MAEHLIDSDIKARLDALDNPKIVQLEPSDDGLIQIPLTYRDGYLYMDAFIGSVRKPVDDILWLYFNQQYQVWIVCWKV